MGVEQVVVREVALRPEHEERRHARVFERRWRRRPSRRRRPRRRPGSSGSASGRRRRARGGRGAPPRRALAARRAAGSRRSGARPLPRTTRRRVPRVRSRLRRAPRWPGRWIAGSSRTSRRTSSGRRAASSKASRPPNECPIQSAGSGPTASSDRVEVRVERPGRLVGRRSVPEQVRRKHVPAVREPVLGQQPSVPAVAGDAVEEDDSRAPVVAPAVEVEPAAHARTPGGCLDRPGRAVPRPHSGGASPPDCTLPRIM